MTLSEFPGRMGESNKTAHFSDSARREESLPHWSRVRSTLEAAAGGSPDRGVVSVTPKGAQSPLPTGTKSAPLSFFLCVMC